MKLKSFNDIVPAAAGAVGRTVVAAVMAHEESTLTALLRARRAGIADSILIGDAKKINDALTSIGAENEFLAVIEADDQLSALLTAVRCVQSGRANALMKGALPTDMFLRTVVARENGFRRADAKLSAVGLYNPASYHKLIAVTDFGMNISPDADAKRAIINNAVALLRRLGTHTPKVAVLSDTERLQPKMTASVHAYELKKLWEAGEIKDCVLEGPIAFDLATSRAAAEIKRYRSPVAGDADILVVPDIVSGNILVKAMTGFASMNTAGTIVGADLPVILTSRSATADDKFYSVALAVAANDRRG